MGEAVHDGEHTAKLLNPFTSGKVNRMCFFYVSSPRFTETDGVPGERSNTLKFADSQLLIFPSHPRSLNASLAK